MRIAAGQTANHRIVAASNRFFMTAASSLPAAVRMGGMIVSSRAMALSMKRIFFMGLFF